MRISDWSSDVCSSDLKGAVSRIGARDMADLGRDMDHDPCDMPQNPGDSARSCCDMGLTVVQARAALPRSGEMRRAAHMRSWMRNGTRYLDQREGCLYTGERRGSVARREGKTCV